MKKMILALAISVLTIAAGEPHRRAGEHFSFTPLAEAAISSRLGDLSPLMREAQHWIAEVLETHLAYPSLTYFRSSHDDESWIGTLGAILDASTLLITTLDVENYGQAIITLRLGTHLVRDFTGFFRLDTTEAVGVEPPEFEAAYNELRAAGDRLQRVDGGRAERGRERGLRRLTTLHRNAFQRRGAHR